MVLSERAILFMRRSKSRQVRVLPSHIAASLSGQARALRATRIGIETYSGKSSTVGCGTRAVSGLISALLLRLDLLDRPAGLLPGAEAALDMSYRRQSHVLRRLGGKRRPPGSGAEEDELVAGLEIVLGVGALGVDPHFEHAARHIDRTRDRAITPQLAWIADVDEGDTRLAMGLHGIGKRHRLDLAVGLFDHLLHGLLDLERHRVPPMP